jgi:hypothetical protein
MGGALLTIAQGFTNGVAGNTFNLKAGTYTITTALSGPNFRYILSGYNAAHGDMGTKPLVTTSTNSTELLQFSNSSSRPTIVNVSFSTTAGTPAAGVAQLTAAPIFGPIFISCKFSGFTNALAFNVSGAHVSVPSLTMVGVEITASTGVGVLVDSGAVTCIGCWVHGNTGDGMSDTGTTSVQAETYYFVANSIFSANANGISATVSPDTIQVQSSDFVSNTAAGLNLVSGSGIQAVNSIFYNNTTYGINVQTANSSFSSYAYNNAYGSNGTAANRNIQETGKITLTANPFTSGNFGLNATAGGGAALKAAGYPGAFPGGSTTGYLDVGAVQSQATSSSTAYAFAQ